MPKTKIKYEILYTHSHSELCVNRNCLLYILEVLSCYIINSILLVNKYFSTFRFSIVFCTAKIYSIWLGEYRLKIFHFSAHL